MAINQHEIVMVKRSWNSHSPNFFLTMTYIGLAILFGRDRTRKKDRSKPEILITTHELFDP